MPWAMVAEAICGAVEWERMRILIKKNKDGSGSLRCERADGSATWQRQGPSNAPFFALHDLAHYAVEKVLGCQEGFFALIAKGWEVDDFRPPWPKGQLPDELRRVELIAGLLDTERASDVRWTAAEFNEQAQIHSSSRGSSVRADLRDEELVAIRELREGLIAQWRNVVVGERLELDWALGEGR